MFKCDTLVRKKEDGTEVRKPKKKFDTQEEAIEQCKKLNARPQQITKLVPYKCPHCHKFHIGRNGKKISDKYRKKLIKDNTISNRPKNLGNFKVVGKIDLGKVPEK